MIHQTFATPLRPVGQHGDLFISIDTETSGLTPGYHDLLAIGAVCIDAPDATFYAECRPVHHHSSAESQRLTGLDPDLLASTGFPLDVVMPMFYRWIRHLAGSRRAVAVLYNSVFDWPFLETAHREAGIASTERPLGNSALDIKAYYAALSGCPWSETAYRRLPLWLRPLNDRPHHAMEDAKAQAETFRRLRSWANRLQDEDAIRQIAYLA